jgi:UDP-3-O-[3-hydroxymyristoyl] glucosamine N-acyltransferase
MHTLSLLAQIIRAELVGDPEAIISRAQSFEQARAGDVTLAAAAAYRARIEGCAATAIIVAPPAQPSGRNLLVASNPKLAFARAIQALHASEYVPAGVSDDFTVGSNTVLGEDLSIHPRVTVGRDCHIGDRVTLYPSVVIGDRVRIGDDAVIHPNVSVYDDTRIGSRVIIHAGTVIGADGFGFVPDEEGRQVKLLQLSRVRIEDDCEIGAHCAIDRGGFTETVLRRGVKLDNFIQVGHGTQIGEDTVVAALTGFSGGTRVGRGCVIAGQVGTAQHITIGDGATITARASITKSVAAGAIVGGMMPARDYNAWRRCQALYSRLPEIANRLRRLERLARRSDEGPGAGG